MSDLEHAGSLVKVIGAAVVLDQNLPLPDRADINCAFFDGIFIAVDGGSIIVRGSRNRRLSVLNRSFYPAK